jgi:hypothetical protein
MKNNPILWLRISYWAGAVLDILAALVMLFPSLFITVNQPVNFQADASYRYAMGMGAPLMIGWTVLLLWADRRPVERKGILPITLIVVTGEVVIQIWGILTDFVPLPALLPTFIMQALLSSLFVFSYVHVRNLK